MRNQRKMRSSGVMGLAAVSVAVLGYLDLTINTQMVGLAAAALSTPFVNPPPKDIGEKSLPVSPVPLFVRLGWGKGLPHDLDLWIACYSLVGGQKTNTLIIGYLHKSSGWMDLLRDDQGGPSYLNEEQAQSNSEVRGVPPNTFCDFNVHLYDRHGGALPVGGELLVIQDKDGDTEVLVANVKFTLEVPGQEITVLSTAWDNHGNFIRDSVEAYPSTKTNLIATRQGQM